MSEIGLRTYLQQIVNMVQDERYEEAILHARHILRHYPKYLAVYRVLGEIYLSNRRFPEAADLFQRVLSAVPDDFLAHFGMATIREEEGNLDAAIWHMERAFEAQPTHVAIQEELRRLYRERDGVAPPRIRFTRVALARIYLHSGLFNQSIVELQAVLQQDPRRLDALALLAQAYYEAGQWVQAADTCNRLLQKLPYCLQANRIMANILRAQGQEEKAQHYWSRVLELDPYEAFVGPEYPTAERVPADKVQVPRLEMEYTSDLDALPSPDEAEVPMLEELEAVARNTGLLDEEDAGPPEDEIFALSEEAGDEEEARASSGPYVPPEQAESLIPEWMQQSGWAPRDPSVPLDAAPAEPLPEDEDEEAEAELVEGEIPEWLQQLRQQMPEAAAPEGEEEPPAAEGEADWLPEAEAPTTALDDLATWLESTVASGEAPTAEPASADAADWLSQALETAEEPAGEPPAAEAADLPDWLLTEHAEAEPSAPAADSEAATLPDWLLAAEAAEEEGRGEALPRVEAEAEAPAEEAELPGWLAGAEAEGRGEAPSRGEAEAEAEIPGELLSDEEAALAWLEQLAAKQGARTEELLTFREQAEAAEEEGRGEALPRPTAEAEAPAEEAELPGWLAGAEAEGQAEAPSRGEAEAEAEAEIPGELLSDEEAALAWLEQLAAKQGARTEELLTFREQAEAAEEEGRGEALPRPTAEALPRVEAEAEAPAEEAELPGWLAGAEAEGRGEAVSRGEAEAEIPGELLSDEEAALAWLEQLAAKQGARTEELLTFREQAEAAEEEGRGEALPRPTAEADAPAEEAELPGWLAGAEAEGRAEAESRGEAEAEAPAEEAELPGWLTGAEAEGRAEAVSRGEAEAEAPAEEAELPGWLAGAEAEGRGEALPRGEAEAEAPAEEAELPGWLTGAEAEGRGEAGPRPAAEADLRDIPESAALEDAIANLAWMEAQAEAARERARPPAPAEDEVEWLLEPETWTLTPAEAAGQTEEAPQTAAAEAEPVPQETLEWVQEVTASDEEGVEVTPPAWVPTQHIPPPETMPLKPLPEVEDPYLDDLRRAREAIANYDLETGLRLYRRLIRRRKHLNAVIEDLLQAQYYYPMSVELLQLLGDAFSRAGRLQDALDTYLKAEELLR